MGQRQHMQAVFTGDSWTVENDRGSRIQIGSGDGMFSPYDLLLGGLEGCLYATFAEVAQKMRASYREAAFEVTGFKRDEDVATLESVKVSVTIREGSSEKKLTRAFDAATRYCSVYQTLSKVAEMSWEISFEQ